MPGHSSFLWPLKAVSRCMLQRGEIPYAPLRNETPCSRAAGYQPETRSLVISLLRSKLRESTPKRCKENALRAFSLREPGIINIYSQFSFSRIPSTSSFRESILASSADTILAQSINSFLMWAGAFPSNL